MLVHCRQFGRVFPFGGGSSFGGILVGFPPFGGGNLESNLAFFPYLGGASWGYLGGEFGWSSPDLGARFGG